MNRLRPVAEAVAFARRAVLERPVVGPLAVVAGVVGLFGLAVRAAFHPTWGVTFNGLTNGALYGLIGVGIVLIYRTNRIINFAAAAIGAVPGITFAFLNIIHGLSWYIAFPGALVAGFALGALIDVAIIRRFSQAPRLILTVATVGVAQGLALLSIYVAIWLGSEGKPSQMLSPLYDWKFTFGGQRFTGDYPFTLIVVAAAALALAAFLRYTRLGIALRASAENADRASLLGIPVKRVQTASWMIAGALAALAIFLRSAIVGVPQDGTLGPKVLLFALTAAVVARMESIPVCLAAGGAIGILAEASVFKYGKDSLTAALMLAVILGVLLLQRSRLSRAYDTGVSTWQTIREFRPIPPELRGLPEVESLRVGVGVAVGAFLLFFPLLVGEARYAFAQLTIITAIIVVSMVILTGWAGQISLGQYGIVGVGACVAGTLVAEGNQDFFVALGAGVLAGAAVAVLIGLPALRVQGLYLAVTTLAFGAAMQFYFLDDTYQVGKWLVPERGTNIALPLLLERVKLTTAQGSPGLPFYYLCLACLGVSVLMARAYRRNRAGRAVVAVRENQRAAASFSVNPARTKLGAFAVSGGIAALGGVLLAYYSGAVDPGTYGIAKSLDVFLIAVIGGVTSLPGAVFGAIVLESVKYLGQDHVKNVSLLVTGPGLLAVLLVLPGGFAEGLYGLRDRYLRWVANRRGLHVPSLVADRRVEDAAEREAVLAAEQKVEEAELLEATGGRIGCPVCGAVLGVEEAVRHEHLVPVGTGGRA
jgi:branched-chain amino acid transport system permease protein